MPRTLLSGTGRYRRGAMAARNLNAEAGDRALRREHSALRGSDPLLQLLPYSGGSIALSLAGQRADGRAIVAVRYRGSIAGAREQLAALLRRVGERSAEDFALSPDPR